MTATGHDDGMRLVSFEMKPGYFRDGEIDQDALMYAYTLTALHNGIDIEAYDIESTTLGAGFIEDRPVVMMFVTLQPRQATHPVAKMFRVVGE